jgi:hypothetical protein
MKRAWAFLSVGCTAIAIVAAGNTSAEAAAHVVKIDTMAGFQIGQSLSTSTASGQDSYSAIPMVLKWSASPSNSVCGYNLREDFASYEQQVLSDSSATRYLYSGTDYDDSYGGQLYGNVDFLLTAHTCSGPTIKRSTVNFAPTVIQDNGKQVSDYAVAGAKVSYSGTWNISHCACFSGTTDHNTTQQGASVTLGTKTDAGAHLGIVMNEGANRGIAKVYLDGILVATVNSNQINSVNRVIVYSSPALAAGAHTLKVVNASTGVDRRIDLDAFLQAIEWRP